MAFKILTLKNNIKMAKKVFKEIHLELHGKCIFCKVTYIDTLHLQENKGKSSFFKVVKE